MGGLISTFHCRTRRHAARFHSSNTGLTSCTTHRPARPHRLHLGRGCHARHATRHSQPQLGLRLGDAGARAAQRGACRSGADREEPAARPRHGLHARRTRVQRHSRRRPRPPRGRRAAKLKEFQAFRDGDEEGHRRWAAASAANDKVFREFREETKPYQTAVTAFRHGPQGSPQELKAAAAQLAKLDALWSSRSTRALTTTRSCPSRSTSDRRVVRDGGEGKLHGERSHQRRRRRLGEPRRVRRHRSAQRREERGPRRGRRPAALPAAAAAGGKAKLEKQLKASLEAAGQPMPEKPFEKLDEALDAFAAEESTGSPQTWTFEAPRRDGALEWGQRPRSRRYPGRCAVKSGMLFAQATIDKTALGVPTERSARALCWRRLRASGAGAREFTAHETYTGGGKYAAPRFTFRAVRFREVPMS